MLVLLSFADHCYGCDTDHCDRCETRASSVKKKLQQACAEIVRLRLALEEHQRSPEEDEPKARISQLQSELVEVQGSVDQNKIDEFQSVDQQETSDHECLNADGNRTEGKCVIIDTSM